MLQLCVSMPMGDYVVSASHRSKLISEHTKVQHPLTSSHLDGKDKMNVRVMQDMWHPWVIALLQNKIVDSQATMAYLGLAEKAVEAYTDRESAPLARVEMIWTSTFLLRIWRRWLADEGFSLQVNLITLNAYLCI